MPGSRNNGASQDLVFAPAGGGDDTSHAAANPPPVQAGNIPPAIGVTIQGLGVTNPDVPMASAENSASTNFPAPSALPAATTTRSSVPETPLATTTSPGGGPSTPSTSGGSPPAALAGSSGGTSLPAGSGPSTSTPSAAVPTPTGAVVTVPYPPIDHNRFIGGDKNSQGRVTGSHSLVRGDVQIVPGTETPPNAVGVYRAQVQIRHPTTGAWTTKVQQNGTPIVNTMFPRHWSEQQSSAEVNGAWASSNRVINGNEWSSVTPSGVRVRGYINMGSNLNRVTAFPLY